MLPPQGTLVRYLHCCRRGLPYGVDEMGLRGVFSAGDARRSLPCRVAWGSQAGGAGKGASLLLIPVYSHNQWPANFGNCSLLCCSWGRKQSAPSDYDGLRFVDVWILVTWVTRVRVPRSCTVTINDPQFLATAVCYVAVSAENRAHDPTTTLFRNIMNVCIQYWSLHDPYIEDQSVMIDLRVADVWTMITWVTPIASWCFLWAFTVLQRVRDWWYTWCSSLCFLLTAL